MLGRWFLEFVRTVWDLLRGSAHYRFAALLVRSGVALMLGPPAIVIIATRMIDEAVGPDQNHVTDALAIAGFVAGLALVIGGVEFFRRGTAPVRYADVFGITITAGETFESVVNLVAARERKPAVIEGFSDADRQRPLKPGELEMPSAVDLLKALGAQVQTPPPFPKYEVTEDTAAIYVRSLP